MGTVYRVRHREWNLDLAVKLPLADVVSDAGSRERLIREAHTWIDLGVHPHIVQCWFVREWAGVPALFLDFLAGGSLKDWKRNGFVQPGEWEKILDLMIQACDGLAHAHRHGVVHRDIKPANLLIRGDDRLCVTDFGLVKMTRVEAAPLAETQAVVPALAIPEDLDEGASLVHPGESGGESASSSLTLTRTGTLLGTPEYGAPEQWTRARDVGVEVDIYALGVVIFELCCGRRPFDDGKKSVAGPLLIGRHISKPAPDPRSLNPQVPESLASVILRCLRKEPSERPESMLELRHELAEVYHRVVGEPYTRAVPEASEQRADALNNKAVSLWHLGNPDEAFGAWEEALRYDAQHPETVYNRSIVQWRLGRVDDEEVARKLARVKGSVGRAGVYLGRFWLERNRPEQAERELEACIEDPEVAQNGAVHRALADARMYQEKYFAAEKAYAAAMRLMPDDRQTVLRKRLAFSGQRRRKGRILFPGSAAVHRLGRPGPALRLLVSRDSSRCLESDGQRLDMWEVDGGASCWRCDFPGFDDPGRLYLAAGGDFVVSAGGRLWDGHTGEGLPCLSGRVLGLGATEDTLLVAREQLELLELPSGTCQAVFQARATAVAVHPDGMVLVGGQDGELALFEPAGACLSRWKGHPRQVEGLCWSADGAWCVSGDGAGRVCVWNPATGELLARADVPLVVQAVRVAADDRFVVAQGQGGACLVDPGNGAVMDRFQGGAAVLGPGCEHLFVQSLPAGPVRLVELPSGRELRIYAAGEVKAMAVTPDGRYLITGEASEAQATTSVWEFDEVSRVYDRALVVNRTQSHVEATLVRERFAKQLELARELRAAEDWAGAYRALCHARSVPGYSRDPAALKLNVAFLEHFPRKALRSVWEAAVVDGAGTTDELALGGDGRLVATRDQASIKLWRPFEGRRPVVLVGHQEAITAVAVSRDGSIVVSGSDDETVRVWAATGECRCVLSGHRGGVGALALSSDARLAVVLTREHCIDVWDLEAGSRLRTIEGVPGRGRVLAVTPDARMAITAAQDAADSLRLWDLARGRNLRDGRGFEGTAACGTVAAALSADGRLAVTASAEGSLQVWELGSGKYLQELAGHGQAITGLALTGEARFALSTGRDQTMRVWDLPSGQCVQLVDVVVPVLALALTPNARYGLTGGGDGSLRLWEFDWELDGESRPVPSAGERSGEGLMSRFAALFRRRA